MADPTLTLNEIARRSGFAAVKRMHEAFRRYEQAYPVRRSG